MDFYRLNPVIRDAAVFEKFDNSKEHVAYDARLFFVFSGGLAVSIGKEKLKLEPQSLLYIPAGTPYKLRAQYARAAVISFDLTSENPMPEERIPPSLTDSFLPQHCHYTADAQPFDKYILTADIETARDSLAKIAELFVSADGYFRHEASCLLKPLLLRLAATADENALPSRLIDSLDEYIRENASDDISNTEIGAIFGYHPFYISKLLKEKRGITMRQYIISRRMNRAMSMLRLTDKTIAEIAAECGFSDASYFTKAFKNIYSITPKEYRLKFDGELI